MDTKVLFQLLHCSVDAEAAPPDLATVDWDELYTFSKQQAITGVMFDLLMRMGGKETGIDRKLFLRWFKQSDRIQTRNDLANRHAVQIVRLFEEKGFRCCVLKGQGNAMMYPNPFARVSGDIDLLLIPQNLTALPKDLDERRNVILNMVRKKFPKIAYRYHHVDFPIIKGLPIELHFIPCVMNNPLYNRRLQQWLGERAEQQYHCRQDLPGDVGSVPVPMPEYNLVFQMAHMMHHYFDEGIGLRQMMDYYYLLLRCQAPQGIREELSRLGLRKFASAVMYVMREVFGLAEEYLIVPADEWRGRTLLDEILRGGNFGHYSGLTKHSTGVKYFLKHWRNLHFVCQYPAEALSEPVFRTWHFFWRLRHRK